MSGRGQNAKRYEDETGRWNEISLPPPRAGQTKRVPESQVLGWGQGENKMENVRVYLFGQTERQENPEQWREMFWLEALITEQGAGRPWDL